MDSLRHSDPTTEVKEEIYVTLNFSVPSPDGNMYVTVGENIRGKPALLLINIGKAGSAVQAWSNLFSRFATQMLEEGKVTIYDLMELLSSTTSDRSRTTEEGLVVRSGPEAVFIALQKYQRIKYTEQISELNLADAPSIEK